MPENIIEIKNLNKIYDNGVHALKNVNLTIKQGEFVSIIGLSGSGKSTLMRCINRLIEPTTGEIIFNGTNITNISGKDLRSARSNIGMIFQHFNLIKRMSVLKNVLSGTLSHTSTVQSILGIFSKKDIAAAYEMLKIVGLENKANDRADGLSGGQQQRVAIARSLMQNPLIMLADEPVASLDPVTAHSIMERLEYANQKLGKTIVCNLHFLSLVKRYCKRVIALKDGEVVYQGDAHQIDKEWFKKIYGEDAKELG